MPYQTVNGIKIFYEEQGRGEPLILVNGLSFVLDLWFAQMEFLSKYFRVIALDNRGIGGSDTPDEEYSIKMMADDTVGLLRSLQIEKTHIIGLSMGGYIAQEIALSYPAVVNRLVLVATCMGGPRSLLLGQPFWEKMQKALMGLPPEEMYRKDLALMSAPGFAEKHHDILEKAAELRIRKPQPMYAFMRQFNACAEFDVNDRAHAITQPTLIVLGEEDLVFPVALADDFRQKIPHSQMIIYENCGHAVLLEKAERLNQDILKFMTAT